MMNEKLRAKLERYDKIQKIAVLTSGGDAPGMNAAIRAVVRSAIFYGKEAYGVYHGYKGLIDNDMEKLDSCDVSNIINRGGTILKTSRCPMFKEYEGREKAYKNLKSNGIDALVVVGGDGSFKGAREFSDEFDIPVVGIPGTIDNDLYGTDYTIGYDTALNVVVDAVDKIRDTAESHDRLFFVEVMGRDAGFIALRSGIASGAEAILIPEVPTNLKKFKKYLAEEYQVKKTSSIVLVAEGDDSGGAVAVANYVKKQFPDFNVRISILGHIQRGGAPSVYDRVTASQMGIAAVEGLLAGKSGVMVGIRNRKMVYVPFEKTVKHHKSVKRELLRIVEILNI